jgi:hypothetical protein
MPTFQATITVLDIPKDQSLLKWKDPKFKSSNGVLVFTLGQKVHLDFSAQKSDSLSNSKLQTVVSYDKTNSKYIEMMIYLTSDKSYIAFRHLF